MPRLRLKPGEVKHGTMTGYAWHQRWKDPACQPCKDAKAVHSRTMNANARKRERENAPRREAWSRACSRLAERYPAEFREILMEEMKNVPPIEQGESDEM